MPDKYRSFEELSAHEDEHADYRIVLLERNATVVFAPHGGGIEPGTSEIAREIAGDVHSLYLFEGVKSTGNASLHLTSHRLNEPLGVHMLVKAQIALGIHGCVDRSGCDSVVFVGGSHRDLRMTLIDALTTAGFPAELDPVLPGAHPRNLCNRPQQGGAQLEITQRARKSMFSSLTRSGRKERLDLFWHFCEAARDVLSAFAC